MLSIVYPTKTHEHSSNFFCLDRLDEPHLKLAAQRVRAKLTELLFLWKIDNERKIDQRNIHERRALPLLSLCGACFFRNFLKGTAV
jgi:hypothetical protein